MPAVDFSFLSKRCQEDSFLILCSKGKYWSSQSGRTSQLKTRKTGPNSATQKEGKLSIWDWILKEREVHLTGWMLVVSIKYRWQRGHFRENILCVSRGQIEWFLDDYLYCGHFAFLPLEQRGFQCFREVRKHPRKGNHCLFLNLQASSLFQGSLGQKSWK